MQLPCHALSIRCLERSDTLSCPCSLGHLFAGLTNRSLRELVAGPMPGYTARQMTLDNEITQAAIAT